MCEIRWGMYGLPQTGIIAQKLRMDIITKHVHRPCDITYSLWNHEEIPVTFFLTVNDFCVKYVGKYHVKHLVGVLKPKKNHHLLGE